MTGEKVDFQGWLAKCQGCLARPYLKGHEDQPDDARGGATKLPQRSIGVEALWTEFSECDHPNP
jgi:hypothetical protein